MRVQAESCLEVVKILTTDNGVPPKATVSKTVIDVRFNTSPKLVSSQLFLLPKNSNSFRVNLLQATDLENDALTYSIVRSPDRGTLSNCATRPSGFSCQYTPPVDFTGTVGFSYKANDGTDDSNTSEVSLKVFSPGAIITKIESGQNHTCALYNEGNIRCWGYNGNGQLGLGHTNTIGDDETPLSQGDVDVGGKVTDISLGSNFTCALLETNKVKCWGNNNFGQLGLRHRNTIGDNETLENVISPDTGGTSALVYPRFSFSPINPKISNQVSFNAGDSYQPL